MSKSISRTSAFLCAALLGLVGCYTQFATLDTYGKAPSAKEEIAVDSAGDTVRVIRDVDTVETREREVCYWQRDLFGRPQLRCYTTYYDDLWYDYYSHPWWYSRYYSYYNCDCYSPYSYSYCRDCGYSRDYCYWYCRDRYYGRRSFSSYPGGASRTSSAPTPPSPRRSVREGVPQRRSVPAPSTTATRPADVKTDSSKAEPAARVRVAPVPSGPRKIVVRPGAPRRTSVRTTSTERQPQEVEGKTTGTSDEPKQAADDRQQTSPPEKETRKTKRRSVREW
jgi:hypothetical protein